MTAPYWQDADGRVRLYLGDCREIDAWLTADVLVTDPPYGRAWRQGWTRQGRHGRSNHHEGIAGDKDTTVRDCALKMWGDRLAIAFGDPMLTPPAGTKQVCGYRKAVDAGTKGTFGGFRRDLEAIYLIGPWPAGLNGKTSILASSAPIQGGSHGLTGRYGHPHAKPVDVMETLIAACPPGVIADPFAGSGPPSSPPATSAARRSASRSTNGTPSVRRAVSRRRRWSWRDAPPAVAAARPPPHRPPATPVQAPPVHAAYVRPVPGTAWEHTRWQWQDREAAVLHRLAERGGDLHAHRTVHLEDR